MVTLLTTIVGFIFLVLLITLIVQFPNAALCTLWLTGVLLLSWLIGTVLKDIFL